MLIKKYKQFYDKEYANKHKDETYLYSNAYDFLLAHKYKNLFNDKNNNSFVCVYNSDYYKKEYELKLHITQKIKNHLKNHKIYFIRFRTLDNFLNIKSFDEFCYKAQFVYINLNDDFCIIHNNKIFVLKLLDYDTNNFKVKALHIKRNQIKEFSIFDLNIHATLTTLRFFPTLSKLKNIYYPFKFLDYDYLNDMYKAYCNFFYLGCNYD